MSKKIDKHVDPGYELSDAPFKPLLLSGIALAALVLVSIVSVFGLFDIYRTHSVETMAKVSPLAEGRRLPPGPRLQVVPEDDRKMYEARQKEILHGYGWVVREGGLVRIPIEHAMEIALEQGFAVRTGGSVMQEQK